MKSSLSKFFFLAACLFTQHCALDFERFTRVGTMMTPDGASIIVGPDASMSADVPGMGLVPRNESSVEELCSELSIGTNAGIRFTNTLESSVHVCINRGAGYEPFVPIMGSDALFPRATIGADYTQVPTNTTVRFALRVGGTRTTSCSSSTPAAIETEDFVLTPGGRYTVILTGDNALPSIILTRDANCRPAAGFLARGINGLGQLASIGTFSRARGAEFPWSELPPTESVDARPNRGYAALATMPESIAVRIGMTMLLTSNSINWEARNRYQLVLIPPSGTATMGSVQMCPEVPVSSTFITCYKFALRPL